MQRLAPSSPLHSCTLASQTQTLYMFKATRMAVGQATNIVLSLSRLTSKRPCHYGTFALPSKNNRPLTPASIPPGPCMIPGQTYVGVLPGHNKPAFVRKRKYPHEGTSICHLLGQAFAPLRRSMGSSHSSTMRSWRRVSYYDSDYDDHFYPHHRRPPHRCNDDRVPANADHGRYVSTLQQACSGCGKFRSPNWCSRNPLVPGEVPRPNMCRSCRSKHTSSEDSEERSQRRRPRRSHRHRRCTDSSGDCSHSDHGHHRSHRSRCRRHRRSPSRDSINIVVDNGPQRVQPVYVTESSTGTEEEIHVVRNIMPRSSSRSSVVIDHLDDALPQRRRSLSSIHISRSKSPRRPRFASSVESLSPPSHRRRRSRVSFVNEPERVTVRRASSGRRPRVFYDGANSGQSEHPDSIVESICSSDNESDAQRPASFNPNIPADFERPSSRASSIDFKPTLQSRRPSQKSPAIKSRHDDSPDSSKETYSRAARMLFAEAVQPTSMHGYGPEHDRPYKDPCSEARPAKRTRVHVPTPKTADTPVQNVHRSRNRQATRSTSLGDYKPEQRSSTSPLSNLHPSGDRTVPTASSGCHPDWTSHVLPAPRNNFVTGIISPQSPISWASEEVRSTSSVHVPSSPNHPDTYARSPSPPFYTPIWDAPIPPMPEVPTQPDNANNLDDDLEWLFGKQNLSDAESCRKFYDSNDSESPDDHLSSISEGSTASTTPPRPSHQNCISNPEWMTYDGQDTLYPGEAYEVSIPGTELTLSRVKQREDRSRRLIEQDYDNRKANADDDDRDRSRSEKSRMEDLDKEKQSGKEREERVGHDAFLAGKW